MVKEKKGWEDWNWVLIGAITGITIGVISSVLSLAPFSYSIIPFTTHSIKGYGALVYGVLAEVSRDGILGLIVGFLFGFLIKVSKKILKEF